MFQELSNLGAYFNGLHVFCFFFRNTVEPEQRPPLNSDYLSATASILGSQGWSLYTNLTVGVNFINVLCTAYALVDLESVKNTVKSSVPFYTFGIYKRESCM